MHNLFTLSEINGSDNNWIINPKNAIKKLLHLAYQTSDTLSYSKSLYFLLKYYYGYGVFIHKGTKEWANSEPYNYTFIIDFNKKSVATRINQLNTFEDVEATIVKYIQYISKDKPFTNLDDILETVVKEKMIYDSLNNDLLFPILALNMISEVNGSTKDTTIIKSNAEKVPLYLLIKVMNIEKSNSFDIFLDHAENSSYYNKFLKILDQFSSKSEPSLNRIWEVVNKIYSKMKDESSIYSEEYYNIAMNTNDLVSDIIKQINHQKDDNLYKYIYRHIQNMNCLLNIFNNIMDRINVLYRWIKFKLPETIALQHKKWRLIRNHEILLVNQAMDFRSDKFMFDYTNEKWNDERIRRRTSVYFNDQKNLQDALRLHEDASKMIYLRTTQPCQKDTKI